jgi:hypothetical protein
MPGAYPGQYERRKHMKKLIAVMSALALVSLTLASLSCSSQQLALQTTITREGSRITSQPPVRTQKPSTVTMPRPTETEHPPTSRITTSRPPTSTVTQTVTRTTQTRPPTVTITSPATTVYRPPDGRGYEYPPFYPYYPPVVTVYPPIVTVYPPVVNYYPPVYPQAPTFYGPFIINVTTGPAFYYLPVMSSGHSVYFNFDVTGPGLYYWVLDPNNNLILLGNGGNSVYMSGNDSFITPMDGVYVIGFYSTQQGIQSTVTLNYSIY